jgi:hypothetical protein
MKSAGGVDGRALRRSLVVGAVVAALLLAAGLVYALAQQKTWTAESVVVVLPASDLDDATSAAYYETLSRGQIVATFAEVAGNLRFVQQAEERLGLTSEQGAQVTTEVTVVPTTAVILVRASAPDAAVAERVADMTTEISSDYLAGLSEPFRTYQVHEAGGTATSSGTPVLLLLAASVLVALVAGLAAQQAAYHLAPALLRRSAGRRETEPAAPRRQDQASSDEVPVPQREVTWGQW